MIPLEPVNTVRILSANRLGKPSKNFSFQNGLYIYIYMGNDIFTPLVWKYNNNKVVWKYYHYIYMDFVNGYS